MALPSPLPDDPRKWDGWNHYGSHDLYERLCLAFDARPGNELIEEHSRQLLVWWQKKLPLKHQPSNPLAQLLRHGLDAAPRHIAEARAELLNPARRAEIDRALAERRREKSLTEFQKYLDFALAERVLTREAEANLFKVGRTLGLHGADLTASIHHGLIRVGATREAGAPARPAPVGDAASARPDGLARLTRQVLPWEQWSPDEERRRFPEFQNSVGSQMLLIPSGRFQMGRQTTEAPIDEQPATAVTLRRFYLSRHPITNAQYEQFDAGHAAWRSPQAGDLHPVVYVNHADAIKFCDWLSRREEKNYRLPTEAEWEYAARGTDGRIYPWAAVQKLSLAKFTLSQAGSGRTSAWRETVGEDKVAPNQDDGCSGASAVGGYPLGASPFGVEDLVGNVWEWCQDFYGPYRGADRMNPPGAQQGDEHVCRGGSWKSPSASLKATTRGHHPPTFAGNDVGFRIVCECAEAGN